MHKRLRKLGYKTGIARSCHARDPFLQNHFERSCYRSLFPKTEYSRWIFTFLSLSAIYFQDKQKSIATNDRLLILKIAVIKNSTDQAVYKVSFALLFDFRIELYTKTSFIDFQNFFS